MKHYLCRFQMERLSSTLVLGKSGQQSEKEEDFSCSFGLYGFIKPASYFAGFFHEKTPLSECFFINRRLASFPQSSIIAATGLDFCVRNGNRYYPSAMDTEWEAPREGETSHSMCDLIASKF